MFCIGYVYFMYRLLNVLCWLWNIYEGAHDQLFPVLVSHPEIDILCNGLLHFI